MVIAVCGLPTFNAQAAPPAYAATASLAPSVRYLGDSAGSIYKFTVRNAGATAAIGGVEIKRPPGWAISSCPAPPAGWTATATSRTCRFRSAAGTAGDIKPGQSRILKVKATTEPGDADRLGEWPVKVSRTNQFDPGSQIKAAAPTTPGALQQTLSSFQVNSAVVSDEPVSPGETCPPANKVAPAGSSRTIVICGRNRASVALAPGDAQSSLSGSYIGAKGTFASSSITPGSEDVVLGSWSGTKLVGTSGNRFTVTSRIGASGATSPLRTFQGYSAGSNDVPTASSTSAAGNEDGDPVTVTLTGQDADGDEVTFHVDAGPTDGVVSGPGPVTCGVPTPNTCTSLVTYTPNSDFHGVDSFTYAANDGTADSATATATITVNDVNDAPAFTQGADQTVPEDAGEQSIEGWASAISAGPANESLQNLDFVVTTEDNSLFASTPLITRGGDLSFTPAEDAHGMATLSVKLADDGGTVNGGHNTSDEQTFTITVTPVNDAPSFAKGDDQVVVENAGAQSVLGWASAVSTGPADESGQSVSFNVTNDNNGLFSSQPVVTPDGTLQFTGAANAAGSATVSVSISDSGETADGGQDTSNVQSFTIAISGVNTPPSFTHDGAQTVLEDSGAQTVTGFVNSTDPGAPDESGQQVTVSVTGTDNDFLFSSPPAIDAAGNLTYTPAPNANGTATVTARATDDGGTADGGDDTGLAQTFKITVSGVNDEPSFTKGNSQTLNEDSGAQSVSNWAAAISKGPGDESGQSLSFRVTNSNNALFSVQPAVSDTGTLTFTSAPNKYGSATVDVSLSDNGGVENGGDDTSPVQTFTITVSPVNDAPVAAAKSYTVQSNMKISLGGLLTGATDPNDVAGDPSYVPSFALGSISVGAGCIGCTVSNVDNASGTFDFDPPAGGTGTYSLSYTVRDNGFPGPGVASASQTITVTVNGPVVWFVDADASVNGTGRLSHPFNNMASATAAIGTNTNQRIFVEDGNVTGNVTLQTDGWLVSDAVTGAGFDAVMGITPPAGTVARPTINSGSQRTLTGTVTLGNNSVVRGLDLAPATGSKGLVANGKTGLTVNQMSMTTTGARAVDLMNSSGVFDLTRVSATGADRGISLVSTNTNTGAFTVSGVGSAGSGGVISGSTYWGVYLQDTRNVTLRWMTMSSNGGRGISGSNVTNLLLEDSTLLNNGTGTYDVGMEFTNLLGTSLIDGVTVTGSARHGAVIRNSSGASTITVSDSTFRDTRVASDGFGLVLQSEGDAAVAFTSASNTFSNNTGGGLYVGSGGTQRMNATINGGNYTSNKSGGLVFQPYGSGGLAFNVTGGVVTGCASCGIPVNVELSTSAAGTSAVGTISGMTITNGNGFTPGIRVLGRAPGTVRVAVTNNNLSQVARGIEATTSGAVTADFTITGNTVNSPATTNSSILATADTGANVCAHIANNAVTNPGGPDIQVINNGATAPFRLPGYAGGATDTTAVQSFLLGRNTAGDATASILSGAGFGGGVACAAP